jgi:BTB/POZ domain
MAAPPPAKKQKVDKAKTPIVFKQTGLGAPDTSLVIFDQEFHVHSMLLKIHSAFFRKFMDSPDKVNSTTMQDFKYYWVAETEEDGEWHLVALYDNYMSALPAFSRHLL